MDSAEREQFRVCPPWCTDDHGDGLRMSHAGDSSTVELSRYDSGAESLELRCASYLPPMEGVSIADMPPVIELTHHADGRSRVMALTPANARVLADGLRALAEQLEAAAPSAS